MKTNRSKKSPAASAQCICQGTMPVLTELLRRLGPPEPVRRHFDAARLEFLKGLRALLDARIAEVSKPKGEKIEVE
jgi:hypothetical protein